MNIPRAGGSARQRGRPREGASGSGRRYPLWRDRRDLRRRFPAGGARRGGRAEGRDDGAAAAAVRGPRAAVSGPARAAGRGTASSYSPTGLSLLLVTRRGGRGREVAEQREPRRGSGARVWLVRAQPSFASCWFRLWFASAGAHDAGRGAGQGGTSSRVSFPARWPARAASADTTAALSGG